MSINRNLRDGLNFMSKLTPGRLGNAAKLTASYLYAKHTGRNWHWGAPFAVSVEPTTHCNLRCPECPSGLRAFTRPTGMLHQELYQQLIDELAPSLAYLTFYFQGEPYLHPRFLDMVRYAGSKNIYTATSTNAHYLTSETAKKTVESGLDRLIVSIDGADQETYQAYRIGGSLQKVLDGARHVAEWKKKLGSSTPYLVFQFLVVRPNEHQVADVEKLAKEAGADKLVLKTAQIYDYTNGNPLIPRQDKYSRYALQADGTYAAKNKLADSCWKMWHSCVVTWDGKVVPCCFDKDAHHQMGTVAAGMGFKEVWHGAAYKRFRAALLQARSQIDMCRNCTEGAKVWA